MKRQTQKRICTCTHSHSVEEDEDLKRDYLTNTSVHLTPADDYFLKWKEFAEVYLDDRFDFEQYYFLLFHALVRIQLNPMMQYACVDVVQLIVLYCIPASWGTFDKEDVDLRKTWTSF